ncbi:MAG: hypothetical protein ACI4C1_06655 [Lachnospiraceae bacterium]
MEELYQMIEEKIKAAGYDKEIDGSDIYNEICDEIEDKENGDYVLMVKKDGNEHFEYHVQIHDEDFNLSSLTIIDGENKWLIDFDA